METIESPVLIMGELKPPNQAIEDTQDAPIQTIGEIKDEPMHEIDNIQDNPPRNKDEADIAGEIKIKTPESSSSEDEDEEDNDKQPTIANLGNGKDNAKIKETLEVDDIQADDSATQQSTKEELSEENPLDQQISEDHTIANCTPPQTTEPEQSITEEEKEDVKQIGLQVLKLNGNHSLSLHDDDDNTCSSTTSSASSHNLVIDDPLAEKILPVVKQVIEEDNDYLLETTKSLKRKLSSSDNDSPQYKQIHLDTDRLRSSSPGPKRVSEEPQKVKEVDSVELALPKTYLPSPFEKYTTSSSSIVKESLSPTTRAECTATLSSTGQEPTSPTKTTSPSPYERYVPSSNSGLPLPKLNFECYRCKNAIFDSYNQLRDHQMDCLLKDNQMNKEKTPEPIKSAQKTPEPIESTAQTPAIASKKRFYLCSSCGTYHENWNLFLHIREIHNRHVCLYCIRLFPTAEKLSLHLEIKHDLEQNHFNSEERLRSVSKGDGNSRFLMCCTCQHVFSEHERFSDHICTEYMQPCTLCNQKGRHLNNCKANPEKRPKVKKKPKTDSHAAVIKSNIPTVRPISITPSDTIKTNNQIVVPTFPVALPPMLHPPPVEFAKQNGFSDPSMPFATQRDADDCNYHSDDSTNMVIDETCSSSNNYVTEMAGVNPFKALDERERLQEEVLKSAESKTTLPPDRVPEAIPEPKPLIVPKIKLRVPKEFQKAVESEISSTDSDEDEEDIDVEEEPGGDNDEKQENISTENYIGTVANESDNNSADDKENTQDWDESNSNLDRILKEIEKTKLDIQRTKEMLEPINNPKKSSFQSENETAFNCPSPIIVAVNCPSPIVVAVSPQVPTLPTALFTSPIPVVDHQSPHQLPQQTGEHSPTQRTDSCSSDFVENPRNSIDSSPIYNDSEDCTASWRTPDRDMYSPTPPPTPNSVWASPLYLSEVSPAILQAVSERENIENMEKESVQAKEVSESDKMNISGDMDVESIHNQEESTMDIEEKVTSPPPPTEKMDFMPIVEHAELKSPNEQPSRDQEEERNLPKLEEIEAKQEQEEEEEIEVVNEKLPPSDGIEVAQDDVQITDLLLDRPIEKFEIVEFVRLCVQAVYTLCLYCNHARRIAVNGHSLVLHLLAQHRFSATVDSITAEELLPLTIVSKLKSFLPELEQHYFNLQSYCSIPPKECNTVACDERLFECFQCRFSTKMHKDLYLHNRKMHLKTAILCFMCRANFFSFSEILCHICPGQPNKVTVFDIKFRCCLCDVDGIPSPFRLMVHLRKKHFACDICLEDCREQSRLSSHVWKHKLHHLCYRCGIAYRNKMDITKHLFWKHGTESIICKRCLQKRWRHVYHFCVPPTSFVCDVCNLCFSKATYLKVHKRVHTGDFHYPCTEVDCEEKFISRKLLLKHGVVHNPPEIKVEEKVESEAEMKLEPVVDVKVEEPHEVEKTLPESSDAKTDPPKEEEDKNVDKSTEPTSKRKKKKSRNKESLEDLNLTAPNLSESDSSDDSDCEKSKTDEKDSLVPNVMLSPPSEEEKDSSKPDVADTDKIMNIWENFKTFQASQLPKQDENDNESLTEGKYPTPILHVACSDHDYCAMYKVRPRAPVTIPAEPERTEIYSDTERDRLDSTRDKSISPTKKKRKSTGSGSSSSDSSSGSDSSCSCGSNCSCSSSGSGSSSSSSSDDDSDSSTSEGRRRIADKKRERADRSRLKSESSMKASIPEPVNVVVENKEPVVPPPVVKENLEPVLIETDLETAESETDEEFYDEHPQKLASELLAQKRDQLRAQMRLSPSHNFDIMENSRPSTPSLPEEMVKEKKVKLKKKKRDRKSTSKSQVVTVPPIKLSLSVNKVELASEEPVVHQTSMQVPQVDLEPPYDLIASPGVAEPPVAHQPLSAPILQNNTVKPLPFIHRMSEGSSCSDADSSLKRSKRARRPNKFYGYTSDDENMPGTPLMIGTRTFKPQPPPQLTWRKEDLPAPSKSILLNKQPRSPRTPKTPAGPSGQVKKRLHQKSSSSAKKKQHKLPPIPTLKIRSKIGVVAPIVIAALPPPPPPAPANHNYSSSRDDSDDTDSSDDDLDLTPTIWNSPAVTAPQPPAVVEAPPPPPPQASVFNQKIPPALLPNPDFATIQYFKRNNIRYPIRPPAGARQPRDGESVYCYCRCPYDEVSEMIACDGENCVIEWFHFECVGIMVAPQGKWFCAECRPKYSNELYPQL